MVLGIHVHQTLSVPVISVLSNLPVWLSNCVHQCLSVPPPVPVSPLWTADSSAHKRLCEMPMLLSCHWPHCEDQHASPEFPMHPEHGAASVSLWMCNISSESLKWLTLWLCVFLMTSSNSSFWVKVFVGSSSPSSYALLASLPSQLPPPPIPSNTHTHTHACTPPKSLLLCVPFHEVRPIYYNVLKKVT